MMEDDEPQWLSELSSGDVAVIVWPHGSDYSLGPFGDVALRGTEVIVRYMQKCRDGAMVDILDPDTYKSYHMSARALGDCEIVERLARGARRLTREQERALEIMGDSGDPFARAQQPDATPAVRLGDFSVSHQRGTSGE